MPPQVLLLLSSWSDNPKPDGSRPISMPDAPDDLAYVYQTEQATLYYTIYEAAQVVRVVAIFPRFSVN